MARKEQKFKDKCGYTTNHEEILDPTPVDAMLHRRKPETLQMMVARLVKNNDMQRELNKAGFETFDDANDFDTGEDYDEHESPYEAQYQTETMLHAEHLAAKEESARIQKELKIKKEVKTQWAKKKAKETLSKPKKEQIEDEDE